MNALSDDDLRPFLDGDVDAFAALMKERVEKWYLDKLITEQGEQS